MISWVFGLLIDFFGQKKFYCFKKIIFIISIITIITGLLYFKYTNFIIENINSIFSTNISFREIILPIGISFYTFQILSYIIDLYRKKIKVQKNFLNLALYISFFPQLIAGPIVRYETIEEQLNNRKESLAMVIAGIERFIIGLGKKVIIANQMALIADTIFNNTALSTLNGSVLILGILAYTFQIYFDFSGYSDMAIGLGKIFGFEFLENFNYPYISKSITDFWRRWHMSLTTFFREYIYIPLGGNRVKKIRFIINMFIVWLLTGLWHGAAWNFIIWGIYYFILLVLEKTIFKNILPNVPNIIKYIVTFLFVNIGWTIFRANNLTDLVTIIKNIFVNYDGVSLSQFIYKNPNLIFSIMFLPLAMFLSLNIMKKLDDKYQENRVYNVIKKVSLVGILTICIMFLVSSMYNPFIYFRF